MSRLRLRKQDLAVALTKDDQEVVGRRDALVVPGREIRWEQILTADWDNETETLTIVLVEPEVVTLELDEPDLLLQLVRERVTASIVLTRRFVVDGQDGFTVMARRPPAGGEITLSYEYDKAVDPDSEPVVELARAALRSVRDELGI